MAGRQTQRVQTITYRSEHEYEIVRKELMAINDKYNIGRVGSDVGSGFCSIPKQVRTRRHNLRLKYAEMSRQRYIITVPPDDRRNLTKLINKAHPPHHHPSDVGDIRRAKFLDN